MSLRQQRAPGWCGLRERQAGPDGCPWGSQVVGEAGRGPCKGPSTLQLLGCSGHEVVYAATLGPVSPALLRCGQARGIKIWTHPVGTALGGHQGRLPEGGGFAQLAALREKLRWRETPTWVHPGQGTVERAQGQATAPQ